MCVCVCVCLCEGGRELANIVKLNFAALGPFTTHPPQLQWYPSAVHLSIFWITSGLVL